MLTVEDHLTSFKHHRVHVWKRRTNHFQDTHIIHVHDIKTTANSAALMCLLSAFMVCLKLWSLKGLVGGCRVWIWIRKQMLDSFSKTIKAANSCIQPFKTHRATGARLRSEWWMCWTTTVPNQRCFFFLLLLLYPLEQSNCFDLQISKSGLLIDT